MLYLLFALMVIFIVFGIFLTKKIFNPLTVFNAIWLIVLFLYQFKLSYLQRDLSIETIQLFIYCILAFSISFIFIYKFKFINKEKKENNMTISYSLIKKILIFWIVSEIIEILVSGGIPIIWMLLKNGKTYFDFGIASVHGFMNALGLVIIMLCYYLYLKQKEKGIKDKKLIAIVALMLTFYLCLITRQVIISAIIQLIVIKLYFRKKIPWKKLLIFSAIGLILFGLVGNIRTGYDAFMKVAMMKNNVPPFLSGFNWVYMYLTMTVANVNNAVINNINNFGFLVVLKAYLPTILVNILYSGVSMNVPQTIVTNAFNVSGFFIDFYVSSGVFGVVLISFIYGFLSSVIFKKVEKNRNEKNILYYAVIIQIILLSFFYNHLLYLPSGFQFVFIFIIFKFFKGGSINNAKD